MLVEANNDVRGVYLAGLKNIVEGTPVDKGRARNNWFLTVGSPSSETTLRFTGSNSEKQLNKIPKGIFNKKIYYTNNLPYIERLEYGSWSGQAPLGWVRVTLMKMTNKIKTL